jgi:polysaccharide export outer membrane protein
MNRTLNLVFAVLLGSAGITQAVAQDGKNNNGKTPVATLKKDTVSQADDKARSPGVSKNPVYLIGPEDILDITVWKEPEVSHVVPVRPDPKVTVIVTAINSQRVYVSGEVLRAGAFPLIPGMTVLQALSSAGGFSPFADVKKIHILRTRDGKQVELPFNYRDVLKGDRPEQNIVLEPGDTIVVP